MLADQLDYIVGVDPHRDSHALAIVHVVSGVVVFESTVIANNDGYAQALKLARGACARSSCVRGRRNAASCGRSPGASFAGERFDLVCELAFLGG